MKRILCLLLACLAAFPAASLSEQLETWMYIPALDALTWLETEEYDEGFSETYMTDDGLILVEVLTLEAAKYGMVGEGSFAERMELRFEGGIANVEEVECEPVCAYPTQRIRFEAGANEDSSIVDATAIWTDAKTFVYIVTTSADAWYGYMDIYPEGAVQAMVDEWIGEIQIEGYASDEWDFAQTSAVLVADRSCGLADAEDLGLVERYETIIEGEFDANALATALSKMTGLDFFVDCYFNEENALVVDWMADSTLVAGLDNREQYEEFFFIDAHSLNWFMMDSLYATIRENLGVEEVYYTMDGCNMLAPAELGILDAFPTDIPYMGSAFYFAHSDVMGDEDYDASYDEEIDEEIYDSDFRAENGIGSLDTILETEFFSVVVPAFWRDLYDFEIVQSEPFGYAINFYEKESGFVFGLEARWFDNEVVQLESVWQGYLGRLSVEKLGFLDLLATYSQPAPDAADAWQAMYETCRDVVDMLIMQDGVELEASEYIDYQA